MKTRLFTLVWGERHCNWFAAACVDSLVAPCNLGALHEHVHTWDIVTRTDNEARLRSITEPLRLKTEFHFIDGVAPSGEILQAELIAQMQRCVGDGSAMMMAPPDSIFGEGTIPNLFAIGKPRGLCVAVPHVRVNPTILEAAPFASNAQLVAQSWKHLHRTWIESDATRKLTNTFAGGVSWRHLGNGIIAVQHLLPTIYLAQFNDTDIPWWQAQTLVGAFDHRWPSKLVSEARHRIVGSSDAAFIAEVTPEFANIPPCTPSDPNEPDRFWNGDIQDKGAAAHFIFARSQINIFRAEPL